MNAQILKHDFDVKTQIRRSVSLSSLQSEDNNIEVKVNALHSTCSDSSLEFCSQSDTEEYSKHVDSGICDRTADPDVLIVLEQKIDRLSDMFLEQCRLLNTVKDELRNSKMMIKKTEHAHNTILIDMLNKVISQKTCQVVEDLDTLKSTNEGEVMNSRARSLLMAIESRREVSLDSEIRDNLISFLQSEDLKQQMVRATAESIRGTIGGCFSHDMSTMYLPILERSHRRLVGSVRRVIEKAFLELEHKSSSLFKSVHKTSGALRKALERHHCLLEAACASERHNVGALQCTVEELLQNELKVWREKVLTIFPRDIDSALTDNLPDQEPVPMDMVAVTPQPADPDVSPIDQLMNAALINKQIQSGDVNGSFEWALNAADLSLVMVACRAVEPALVFGPPCKLRPHVVLSLVQQLTTDMVHETLLKCRYLEEAIIHLNTTDPDYREHLPLVVGEVRTHLSKFISAYPKHKAKRRITLIVMAANNLLK